MIYALIDIIAVLVPVLLVVAYVTLLERKVLGSLQRRVGPDTVGIYGILQPFADALKLLVKEMVIPQQSQKVLFILAPGVTLASGLIGWGVIPFGPGLAIADLELGWLFSLAASSVAVYGILFSGWSSNSAYGLIGSLRSTAQLVSYELALSGAALVGLLLVGSFSLTKIVEMQEVIWLAIPLLPIFLIFLITCLSELNRTPFDLVEAESELVSGFMTEYSAFIFVAFFLFEYSGIVILSSLTAILFCGGYSFGIPIPFLYVLAAKPVPFILAAKPVSLSAILLGIKTCLLTMAVVWVRGTLPRLRYDQLMVAAWTILLPLIFGLFVIVLSIWFVI